MADFTSSKINKTYQRIVQVDNATLQDGYGRILSGSMADLTVNGVLTVTGQLSIGEYSNVSASIAHLDQFSSSLDATYATDAQLQSVSSSIELDYVSKAKLRAALTGSTTYNDFTGSLLALLA